MYVGGMCTVCYIIIHLVLCVYIFGHQASVSVHIYSSWSECVKKMKLCLVGLLGLALLIHRLEGIHIILLCVSHIKMEADYSI